MELDCRVNVDEMLLKYLFKRKKIKVRRFLGLITKGLVFLFVCVRVSLYFWVCDILYIKDIKANTLLIWVSLV